MKLKKFDECDSVQEFADNSALFQVLGLNSVTYNNISHEELLCIPHEYNQFYTNHDLFLLNDVELFKEMDKKQWEKGRELKILESNGGSIRINAKNMDSKLDRITTVAFYVKDVCHQISKQSKKPVILILNARSATPYSYIYESNIDIQPKSLNSSSRYNDVDELALNIKNGTIQSGFVIMTNFKISSREYVQTVKEAKLLSGINPEKNKLRKKYNSHDCYVNEYIPEEFLNYMKKRYPIVFVDIPTWGKYYASSTGIARKQKDLDKKEKGIHSPYKFKTYMEYAGYQIAALSLHKEFDDSIDKIKIDEENLARIDVNKSFCLILNPEKTNDIWWDNCPQITGIYGLRFSDSGIVTNSDINLEKVITNQGVMSICDFVKRKIGGSNLVL